MFYKISCVYHTKALCGLYVPYRKTTTLCAVRVVFRLAARHEKTHFFCCIFVVPMNDTNQGLILTTNISFLQELIGKKRTKQAVMMILMWFIFI